MGEWISKKVEKTSKPLSDKTPTRAQMTGLANLTSRVECLHRPRNHLYGLSVVVLQDLPIGSLDAHTKHEEILSRTPYQHLRRLGEKKKAECTYIDNHHLSRTPSNSDSNITHRTLPLPRLHRPILNSLTPRSLHVPVLLEPAGEYGLSRGTRRNDSLGGGDIQARSGDSSRGQGLEYALTVRHVLPDEDLLDGNADLALQRDLECRFLALFQIEISRGRY